MAGSRGSTRPTHPPRSVADSIRGVAGGGTIHAPGRVHTLRAARLAGCTAAGARRGVAGEIALLVRVERDALLHATELTTGEALTDVVRVAARARGAGRRAA